ncbi:hypothetical protein [Pseudomonas oryzihabitans]|uniref:hypothetical protein n=1 Tax=Pseudomonas oryzihabitans TaxID=47885 RepID=UPI00289539AD|nr:hypothetical protein [Pseudomonas oryzihabitans]MDT3719719.1 hypothetical protein [Pseudomonas oryzihabitans]
MKTSILLVLTLTCSLACADEFPDQSLCSAGEATLFNCILTKKTASLCLSKTANQIQYRIGTGLKKEFIYPKLTEGSIEKFKLSATPYPGGGENRIRFSNGTYSYFIYDITKTQADASNGESIQAAGIVVYARNKRIANLKCSNSETSITSSAFETLQRESFSREIDTD